MSNNHTGIKWGISTQGAVLVGIVLAIQLAGSIALYQLSAQAEAEAERIEKARLVATSADSLMLIVYYTCDGVGRLARTLQGSEGMNSETSHRQADSRLQVIKREMSDNAEIKSLLPRIERDINICLPLMDQIEAMQSTAGEEKMREELAVRRKDIQPNVRELVRDMSALVHICRSYSQVAPQEAQANRRYTLKFLYVVLILNAVMLIVVFVAFTLRITRRLSIIKDNTVRLKEHRELLPALGGGDEIGYLDKVFHETAKLLASERRLLKNSEEQTRALVEQLPTGIVLTDEKAKVEFINLTIERDFAVKPQNILGQHLHVLVERPAQTGHATWQGLKGGGEKFPVEGKEIKLLSKKSLYVLQDLTEKNKLTQERDRFVSMVREQLKEPLTALSSFMTRLAIGRLGPISPKAFQSTKQMETNIDRLLLLLNDLFDIDQLESGNIEVEPVLTRVDDIFQRTHSAVTMFANKHKVELDIAPCAASVHADANRIVQVLVNLLSNAIKFSEPGGKVSLVSTIVKDRLEMSVIDQGRGIPADKLETIFEPYKQVEEGDAKQKGGTGLGLAVCKIIVEAHHGSISVSSEVGKGSVFTVSLPWQAVHAQGGGSVLQ